MINNNLYKILQYLAAAFFIIIPIILGPAQLQTGITHQLNQADDTFINVLRIFSIIIGIIMIFLHNINDMLSKYASRFEIESRVLIALLAFICILGLFHMLTMNSAVFNFHFNLDNEYNFTTWVSAVLLCTVGILSLASSILSTNKDQKFLWAIFSVLFFFLSLDEVIQIHESLIRRFHVHIWYLIGAPVAIIVFGLIIYIAIKSEINKSTIKGILLGLAMILIGAVGLEMIGKMLEYNSVAYYIEVLIEECLELSGTSVIIYTIIRHIRIEWLGKPETGNAKTVEAKQSPL